MSNATDEAWAQLSEHAARLADASALDLFAAEPDRTARFAMEAAGVFVDVSKHALDAPALEALESLAHAADVEAAIALLFSGAVVNPTEARPALHMAWRGQLGAGVMAGADSVDAVVADGQAAVDRFAAGVVDGSITGATGRAIRSIVHIGIGGSDLGPQLVYEALKRHRRPGITLRFVANIDPADLNDALEGLDPEETLVVAVSKSFGTIETLTNATLARAWLAQTLGADAAGSHFAAVSANPDKAQAFGVAPERVFGFQDWVGGRYSVWSPVSLALHVAFQDDVMARFRAGAAAMDQHVRTMPIEKNLAVRLALVAIWERVLRGRGSRVVIPYSKRLRLLSSYLQQLEMESNGKGVTSAGEPVERNPASQVWGAEGTNAQHAFFQQLHQGPHTVPVEFVGVVEDAEANPDSHRLTLANLLAQGEALLRGADGGEASDPLAVHRRSPGARPSTTILLNRLEPETVGALIALYEHKVFVEGAIFGVNSFDQFGVELGKKLAGGTLAALKGEGASALDPSTTALVARIRAANEPAEAATA